MSEIEIVRTNLELVVRLEGVEEGVNILDSDNILNIPPSLGGVSTNSLVDVHEIPPGELHPNGLFVGVYKSSTPGGIHEDLLFESRKTVYQEILGAYQTTEISVPIDGVAIEVLERLRTTNRTDEFRTTRKNALAQRKQLDSAGSGFYKTTETYGGRAFDVIM